MAKIHMKMPSQSLLNRNQNRSTVISRKAMVCTSQPLATMAGVDVLKNGGNAIDAAIGANAMLGLVEPMSCGPGGDLFAIVWVEKDGRLYGLNASGRAPFDWSLGEAGKLGITSIPPYDALSWSVPGCVSGWQALLERFGSQSLSEVLAPAAEYAQEGFPLSPIIAATWPFDGEAHPTLAQTFLPGGRAPRFGDIFKNPGLAQFYRTLINEGAQAFYEGEIAERIVAFSKNHGGRFALRDFKEHTVTWVDPISTSYRGYDVWELPPNGQGITVLQMLNLLEYFDIQELQPNSPKHIHLFVEAKKLAFEDRARYYADPEFATVPVERLVSKEYARERVKNIHRERPSQGPIPGVLDESDTVYLTTADKEGNMVSLIQSVYHGWGSHLAPDGLGFTLQNRGSAFSLDPNHANRLEAHKRPFHTIIPAFVTKDGRPVFSFGVMGGEFQPQGHVQILMNLLDFHMSPQQAGEEPRAAHTGSSDPDGTPGNGAGVVELERGFSGSTKKTLARKGHAVVDAQGTFGGYQGIWREENPRRYYGASDPRKDGCALGY